MVVVVEVKDSQMPADPKLPDAQKMLLELKDTPNADKLLQQGKSLQDVMVDPLPDIPDDNEVSAVDDPHMTSLAGDKFDLYESKPYDLVVVPRGAKPKQALLHIRGFVEKYGGRENDLWIRRLRVQGKWVKGKSYAFTTTNGAFNNEHNLLVRRGRKGEWMTLSDLDKADPQAFASAPKLDAQAPSADFQESVAGKAEIEAGPVRVLVSWATAQKEGEDVNHLDLHVQGLQDLDSEVGGLLAGEIDS